MTSPPPPQRSTPQSLPPPAVANTGMTSSSSLSPSGAMDFGLSTSSAVVPPSGSTSNVLISPDQSSISQYVIGQVGTNPVSLGFNVTGAAAQPTTISAALQDFYELSPAQLVQLETMLWDGGFYVNSDGSPMTQAPTFGSYDSESWTAFAKALEQASSSHSTVMGVIQQNIQTGVGAAQHTTLPTAVLGGGNTYQIDLTNPTDVAYTAQQIFQAALGRNPTQAEDQAITQAVNSQTISQGYAQEAGHEQQSQAQYQAQQSQRNTQYAFQTTPKLAAGAVPNGPFQNNSQWAAALLGYMGLPVTASNIAFMAGLASQLGAGTNSPNLNPLNVVMPQGGSQTKGSSQSFQSWSQSLQSTAEELLNGKYQGIVAALQTGSPQQTSSLSQALQTLTDGKVSKVTPSAQQGQEAATTAAQYQGPGSQVGAQQPTGGLPAGITKGATMAGQSGSTISAMNAPPAPQQQAGTNIAPGVTLQPGQTLQQAEQASLQAAATNPQVAAYMRAQEALATNPADLNQTQQPPNPGDQYLNPVTTITTNPESPSAAAYQEATTGANRPAFLGNEYLNAYAAILNMIKSGGPTG